MGKAQTRASANYQKRQGIIAKSYKMKKETAERFKKACKLAGVSQTYQISKIINDYCDEVERSIK